ncbi:cfr9IM [Symbiodinium microadriaticum]|nr:cfr9IM [Symbiodinium microadriaticum]
MTQLVPIDDVRNVITHVMGPDSLDAGRIMMMIKDKAVMRDRGSNYGLTARQAELLDFIRDFTGRYGHAPSFEDMMNGMGLKSKSGIDRMIKALEARYWYLASPYAGAQCGKEEAAQIAIDRAGALIREGVNVFCPIAHAPVIDATIKDSARSEHDLWMPVDLAILQAAEGLIVMEIPGWETSKGIRMEMEFAANHNLPIIQWPQERFWATADIIDAINHHDMADTPAKRASTFFVEAMFETLRAREKFPDNKNQMAALTEEVGELAQALLQRDEGRQSDQQVYGEAIQVAAMALRVATEGDSAFGYDPKFDLKQPVAECSIAPDGRIVRDGAMASIVLGQTYRDRVFGVDGQIGLEPSLGEHLDVMTRVFDEVKRVLKPSGTCWLNYGDCYATTPNGRSAAETKAESDDDRTFRDKPFSTVGPIYDPNYRTRTTGGIHAERRPDSGGRIVAGGQLKPKDLCMVPNRLAIALQEAGWWVRSEIIWAKPNPMPESVTDRPATAHEKIFLLTKSGRYFYDAEAVLQPASPNTHARLSQDVMNQIGSERANGGRKTNGNMKAVARKPGGASHKVKDNDSFDSALALKVTERNLRNYEPVPVEVWRIATKGFSEAHFATFPPELVHRCLKAGCPTGGTVLDPFGGAGTTALVADGMGLDCTLIELNPAYSEIAQKRIDGAAGLFSDVKVVA